MRHYQADWKEFDLAVACHHKSSEGLSGRIKKTLRSWTPFWGQNYQQVHLIPLLSLLTQDSIRGFRNQLAPEYANLPPTQSTEEFVHAMSS